MQRISDRLFDVVSRYWILLCLTPILLITSYLLMSPDSVDADSVGGQTSISLNTLALFLVAVGLIFVVVLLHRVVNKWLPWLAGLIAVLLTTSVAILTTPDLNWRGDVGPNNYAAALVAFEEGPINLISSWNARANPYVQPNYLPFGQEVIDLIDRLGLSWTVGSRWDRQDLPQDNNRMHIHPPLNPVVLGGWMSIFGPSRLASTVYALFLRFALIVGTVYWSWRYFVEKESLNRSAFAMLLATAVPNIRVFIPHSNELAALFAVVAVAISVTTKSNRFLANFFSGVLLALAVYTNFMFIFLAGAAFLVFNLSAEGRKDRMALAFALGGVLVIFVFALMGYYPWLTFFTGQQVEKYYRLKLDVNFILAMGGYIAISIPLIVVWFLSLRKWINLKNPTTRLWMLAVLAAIVLYALRIFPFPPGRYLTSYFFLLTPLFALTLDELNFSKWQVLVIPLTNIAYVLVTFFL